MSRARSAALAVVLTVSCTEFPNEPTKTVSVRPASAAWTQEWFVRDTGTLTIEVKLPDSTPVAGLNVEWQSDDPAVLEVTEIPPGGTSLRDSLTVQLRAKATAWARGRARVTVVVEGVGAFEQVRDTGTITVHERWRAISAGATHTCAIAADSSAYCWGQGLFGALGNGRDLQSPIPVAVITLGALKFLSISAGEDNSCGIIVQGVIYCWGSGANGRLGNGDGSLRSQLTPTPLVGGLTYQNLAAGRASCGIAGVIAYCWGDDSDKQLGFQEAGTDTLDRCLGIRNCAFTPRVVTSNANDYAMIDVGPSHTCAVSRATPGRPFCWGTGARGALGAGPATTVRITPIEVLGVLNLRQVSAGGEHTCGVAQSGGRAYCWGNNNHGQLGNGTTADTSAPVMVAAIPLFDSITSGRQHTCGLAGTVAYCWGQGSAGQLGDSSLVDRPTLVAVRGGLSFASLSAGDSYTCGVTARGAAFCWGSNATGQLGSVDVPVGGNRSTPARVSEPN